MLGLPAPLFPLSASLGPTTARRVLSAPVPVSAPPTGLGECLFFISLVSDSLAVRFFVSSGCARRCSVSTYAAILVLPYHSFLICSFADGHLGRFHYLAIVNCAAVNIGVHRFFRIGVSGFLGYKTRMRYHFTPIRMGLINKSIENIEKNTKAQLKLRDNKTTMK